MDESGSRQDRDDRAFLTRLAVQNYKSIAACDVRLCPFTALVGPNGAGKSNFLDAIRFVADSLRNSLEYALRERGGINEVRRRSHGHPTHFRICMEMNLPDGAVARYGFRIGSSKAGAFLVQEERCSIRHGQDDGKPACYHVVQGKLADGSTSLPSAIESDRLYLGVVSGLPAFRPIFDALTRMGFYNLNPAEMRELQDPDPAEVLARDGHNIPSILGRLRVADAAVKQRIEQYLEAVVPEIKAADVKHLGPKETLEFRQQVAGASHPWRFLAANMSDGTLRVLGILVALFQGASGPRKRVPLIGIEEPEVALHPAATGALAGAILEAVSRTQVLITSHSPDLLDHHGIASDSILAVVAEKGMTIIGPVDDASREALRQGLYSPGELLRIQQIQPSAASFTRSYRQLDLFGDEIAR